MISEPLIRYAGYMANRVRDKMDNTSFMGSWKRDPGQPRLGPNPSLPGLPYIPPSLQYWHPRSIHGIILTKIRFFPDSGSNDGMWKTRTYT